MDEKLAYEKRVFIPRKFSKGVDVVRLVTGGVDRYASLAGYEQNFKYVGSPSRRF